MTLIFILKIRKKLLFIKVKIQQYLNLFQLHFTPQLHFLRKEFTFGFYDFKSRKCCFKYISDKEGSIASIT